MDHKRNATTHWTGSWQARPNKNIMGGVKQVSNPHVRVKGESTCHTATECSYLPRGTYTDCRGVASYLVSNWIRNDSQCTRTCSLKQRGVICGPLGNPPTITADSLNMYHLKLQTDKDSLLVQKTVINSIVKTVYLNSCCFSCIPICTTIALTGLTVNV